MKNKEMIFYIYAIAGWFISLIILILSSLYYIDGFGYVFLVVINLPILIIELILTISVLVFMVLFIIFKVKNK